jgi:hypothetical protein
MIRVSVMANDSILVDKIAAILAREIRLDVLQLTYRQPRNIYEAIRDHRSVVILIDEGDSDIESISVSDPKRVDCPLLVIKISLKSRNIHIFESYRLGRPGIEQVVRLVRDFCRTLLRKREKNVTWAITWRENI